MAWKGRRKRTPMRQMHTVAPADMSKYGSSSVNRLEPNSLKLSAIG